MSAKEKALRDMIAGKNLDHINKEHSTGSVYRAFPDWLKHAENIAAETQKTLNRALKRAEEAEKKANAAEIMLNQITTRISGLEEKEKVSVERVSNLETANITAKENLSAVQQKAKQVNSMVRELAERGLTEENLAPIIRSDIRSPVELLERIQTAEQHVELLEENFRVQNVNESLRSQSMISGKQLAEVKEAHKSERNILDELKSKHSLWLSAIELVTYTFKLGFSVDILKQLVRELQKLNIKGEPKRSAKRVLSRMNKVVEEVELDIAITGKRTMLASLDKQYSGVLASIEALKKGVLQPIRESQDEFRLAMAASTQRAIENLGKTQRAGEDSINALTNAASTSISASQQEGTRILHNIENSLWMKLMTLFNVLEVRIGECNEETRKWGNLKEEAGRLDFYLTQTVLLFGPLTSPEAILQLDQQLVQQLVNRLHLYTSKRFTGVKTKIPRHIAQRELAFTDVWELDLTSISELFAHELERFLKEAF